MNTLAFIGMPGQTELIIFLIIVLIFFGKRLPTAMFSVGKSISEFKKGVSEGGGDADDETEAEPAEKAAKTAE